MANERYAPFDSKEHSLAEEKGMVANSETSRRHILYAGVAAGAGILSGVSWRIAQADAAPGDAVSKDESSAPEDILPAEDLMREHGVLNRILLIYEESCRRLDGTIDLEPAILAGAAKIIRTFIEDYHEKLEEDHLFPRFEKAGKLVVLVKTLREQHEAGRRLTGQIEQLATPAGLKDADARRRLGMSLAQFVRMYRPHEAREDTVLFPAIRSLMTPKQYDELGDQFEDKEHQLFGDHGFENIVEQVARIEKAIGIYELSQFTPKL
jgi:hemerythrin-like domain-containing protein